MKKNVGSFFCGKPVKSKLHKEVLSFNGGEVDTLSRYQRDWLSWVKNV